MTWTRRHFHTMDMIQVWVFALMPVSHSRAHSHSHTRECLLVETHTSPSYLPNENKSSVECERDTSSRWCVSPRFFSSQWVENIRECYRIAWLFVRIIEYNMCECANKKFYINELLHCVATNQIECVYYACRMYQDELQEVWAKYKSNWLAKVYMYGSNTHVKYSEDRK